MEASQGMEASQFLSPVGSRCVPVDGPREEVAESHTRGSRRYQSRRHQTKAPVFDSLADLLKSSKYGGTLGNPLQYIRCRQLKSQKVVQAGQLRRGVLQKLSKFSGSRTLYNAMSLPPLRLVDSDEEDSLQPSSNNLTQISDC